MYWVGGVMDTEMYRWLSGIAATVIVGWIQNTRNNHEKLKERVEVLERKNDVMQATLIRLDTIAQQFHVIQVEITKLTSEVKHLNRNIGGNTHGMDI